MYAISFASTLILFFKSKFMDFTFCSSVLLLYSDRFLYKAYPEKRSTCTCTYPNPFKIYEATKNSFSQN